MPDQLDISSSDRGIRFAVHIQPKASRTEVIGLHGTALKVRVKSPPVDGKANEELLRFLAEWLRVAPQKLRLVRGHTSRQKLIEAEGLTAEFLLNRLKE